MKLFDEFLGFMALTWPLPLIVLWFPVCIALAVLVGKKGIKRSLPFKIIGGAAYLNYLCKTEAGVKIYQPIELPADYWDKNGKPKFYNGSNNNDVPSYAFQRLGIDIKVERIEKKRLFSVNQSKRIVKDKKTGKKYSQIVEFGYGGGWLIGTSPAYVSSISCEKGGSYYDKLVQQQFIPIKKER